MVLCAVLMTPVRKEGIADLNARPMENISGRVILAACSMDDGERMAVHERIVISILHCPCA